MQQETYGITVVTDQTPAEAEAAIRDALAAEGFGILTEIDVAATFKKKLDLDHPPYKILGACNPNLASQAIGHDPRIGLLLPCNVIVAHSDDGTVVSIMDPQVLMEAAGDAPEISALADQVRASVERALSKLA